MGGCPDLCLCAFDQSQAERIGLDAEGLGTPEQPFYVQPSAGCSIPHSGTAAERGALALADTNIGLEWFETDTGLSYKWAGSLTGWLLQTVFAIEDAPGTVSISAGVGVWQDVCTLVVPRGAWALWAKANVEASVEPNPVVWSFRLYDTDTGTDLDLAAASGVFEDVAVPTTSILRPVALQDLVTFQVQHTVVFSVGRSSTEGSQLLAHPKLMGMGIPLPLP